jgi:hypothetical protein
VIVACMLVAAAALGGVGHASNVITAAQGAYGKKVTICHKGKTISVAKAAEPAHMRHGDAAGTCAAAAAKAKKAKAAKAAAAKAKAEQKQAESKGKGKG